MDNTNGYNNISLFDCRPRREAVYNWNQKNKEATAAQRSDLSLLSATTNRSGSQLGLNRPGPAATEFQKSVPG